VSLAFLSPVAASGAIARSPMEGMARAAGAEFEVRDGWNVAVRYRGVPGARYGGAPSAGNGGAPDTRSVAWADVSHLRKWEVDGAAGEFGVASRSGEAWVCPLTGSRALVIGGSEPPAVALEVTCNHAALTIFGPNARETIARFCALDLRPDKAPPHSFRPGSIARQPGMILVQAPDRFLLLFGWAVGEYMWTVVADAAKPLGGHPVGIEALPDA
jgi:glycine cleavage system aminomethyltransferase T